MDIGVHQDGLGHISQLADRFADDPRKFVKVGQIVRVSVLEVNERLKRIALSMKSQQARAGKAAPQTESPAPAQPRTANVQDLLAKFNRR